MRTNGRGMSTALATCVALLLAGAVFVALSTQYDAEPGTGAVLQRVVPAEESASGTDVQRAFAEAPSADIEPLLPAVSGFDAPPPLSNASVTTTWDEPLPESHERAPCTLVVVDARDVAVPDARVEVFGDGVEPVSERTGHGSTIKHPQPVGPITLFTDAEGRCVVQSPRYEPRATVAKDGVGCSGVILLGDDGNEAQFRELRVVLQPFVHLRGVVVDDQGVPAPDALVSFFAAPIRPGEAALMPPPQTTDAQGRFDVSVDAGTRWIVAKRGTSVAKSRRFRFTSGSTPDVVLWLPGNWAVRGLVLSSKGSGGTPVNAWVRFWPDADDPAALGALGTMLGFTTHAEDVGNFVLPLERPMRGRLTVWQAGGVLLAPVSVAVSAEDPQPRVVLQLVDSSTIAGRIVDAHGKPYAGVGLKADATPVTTTPRVMRPVPDAGDLWGSATAVSADDGTFLLSVPHPEGVYTISTVMGFAGQQAQALARSVRAGTSGLTLRIAKHDEGERR